MLEEKRRTHASEEGEVGEVAMIEETSFVAGHAVADLRVNLRCAALQWLEIVELRHRDWVLNPCKKLFV